MAECLHYLQHLTRRSRHPPPFPTRSPPAKEAAPRPARRSDRQPCNRATVQPPPFGRIAPAMGARAPMAPTEIKAVRTLVARYECEAITRRGSTRSACAAIGVRDPNWGDEVEPKTPKPAGPKPCRFRYPPTKRLLIRLRARSWQRNRHQSVGHTRRYQRHRRVRHGRDHRRAGRLPSHRQSCRRRRIG